MKTSIFAALAALSVSTAAVAQDADHPRVTVIGEGSAEQPPDYLTVAFTVRGEAPLAGDALSALKTSQARIEGSVAALKGVASLQLNTNGLTTNETYRNPNCRVNPTLAVGDCAPSGVVVNLNYIAKVFPAERAGDVASLVTQLGAINVRTAESGLKDQQKLADAAAAQAFAKAKAQAEQAAGAAGMALGPIVSIQPSGRPFLPLGIPAVAPAPPPPTPSAPVPLATPLDLKPAPMRQTATVTVTFNLLPKR